MVFVILAFSEHYVDEYVALIGRVPFVGARLETPFKEMVGKQKAALHGGTAGHAPSVSHHPHNLAPIGLAG